MSGAIFRESPEWQQIILSYLIAQGGLSEVGDGGVAKQLASAVAQALDEFTLQMSQLPLTNNIATCFGDNLRRRVAVIFPNTLSPIDAQRATVFLTFTRSVTVGQVTIPAQTSVQTAGGVAFLTSQDATLADGVGQLALVAAVAKLPGAAGNVGTNTLVQFGNRPAGIDSVTNPAPAAGGQDAESDDSIKGRAYDYVKSLSTGTKEAFVAAALGTQDPATLDTILYAKVSDDPLRPMRVVLYVSDATGGNQSRSTPVTGENLTATRRGPPVGTAEGGETRFVLANWPVDPNAAYQLTSSTRGKLSSTNDYYLEVSTGQVVMSAPMSKGEQLTADYAYYTGVLQLVQRKINGYPDDSSIYTSRKLAGQFVRVAAPQIITQDVTSHIELAPGFAARPVFDAVAQAQQALLQGGGIGDDLLIARLVAVSMQQAGCANIVFSKPTADVLVGDGQLIRPGTVQVQ